MKYWQPLVHPDFMRIIVIYRLAHVRPRHWIALGEESLAIRSTQMLTPILIGPQALVRQSKRHKNLQCKVCGSGPLLHGARTGRRVKGIWSGKQFVSVSYVHHRHVKVLKASRDILGMYTGVATLFLNAQEYKRSVKWAVANELA